MHLNLAGSDLVYHVYRAKYKTNTLWLQRNQMISMAILVSRRLPIENDCSSSSMVEVTVAVVSIAFGLLHEHIKERVAQLQCAFDKSKRTSAQHKSAIRPNRIFFGSGILFVSFVTTVLSSCGIQVLFYLRLCALFLHFVVWIVLMWEFLVTLHLRE